MSEIFSMPAHFEPITDEHDIIRSLQEGVKTLATVMIWTKHQDFSFQTYLNHCHELDKAFCVWKPKEFSLHEFKAALGNAPDHECFFNLSLLSSSLFFKTRFLGPEGDELKFKAPDNVSKVQRRSYFRLPIMGGAKMQVRFQDPVFPESTVLKKLLDIGAGGLSFLALDQEEALFAPGMPLKNVSFTINDRAISCDAEVRHFKVMPPRSNLAGIKVGVRFSRLGPSDTQFIAAYVFEESRKFFARYL